MASANIRFKIDGNDDATLVAEQWASIQGRKDSANKISARCEQVTEMPYKALNKTIRNNSSLDDIRAFKTMVDTIANKNCTVEEGKTAIKDFFRVGDGIANAMLRSAWGAENTTANERRGIYKGADKKRHCDRDHVTYVRNGSRKQISERLARICTNQFIKAYDRRPWDYARFDNMNWDWVTGIEYDND